MMYIYKKKPGKQESCFERHQLFEPVIKPITDKKWNLQDKSQSTKKLSKQNESNM